MTGLNSEFTLIFISRCGQADIHCQDSLGVLFKYLNSQVHPGSTESEFSVLELRTFVQTTNSDDILMHTK